MTRRNFVAEDDNSTYRLTYCRQQQSFLSIGINVIALSDKSEKLEGRKCSNGLIGKIVSVSESYKQSRDNIKNWYYTNYL